MTHLRFGLGIVWNAGRRDVGKRHIENSLPALDGLRGFACLLVVFTHMGEYGWWKSGVEIGAIGVLLFFNLSGFLMAYHYLPGERSLKYWFAFLIRRILRVYPAYVFVATLVWFGSNHLKSLSTYSGYPLADIWMVKIRFPMDRPFWTMAVELKFYMYFCIAAALSQLFRIPISNLLMFFTVITIVLLTFIMTHIFGFTQFYLFFFGGVLAGLLTNPATFNREIKISCADAIVFSLVALLVGYIAYGLINHYVTFKSVGHFRSWMRINGYCFAPIFVFFILSVQKASNITKYILFSNPVMRFIGKISFSLYLSHVFVICLFTYYVQSYSFLSFITLSAIITLIAFLLFRFVEEPFNNVGKTMSKLINS